MMRALKLFCLLLFSFEVASAQSVLNCDSLRLRCYNFLSGGAYDLKNPAIRDRVIKIGQNAKNTWKKGFVSDTAKRMKLWTDLTYKTSADMTTSYTRLYSMALSYALPGTDLYRHEPLKSDIIAALDWLQRHHYNERSKIPRSGGSDNWWDYRIGSPDRLCNIMVLLYDQLDPARRKKYLTAINHSTPTVDNYTGANLLWIARIIALNGILSNDYDKVRYAREGIKNVFNYVSSGDGFYEDGSFIQHNKHPYTGGYGAALLGSLAEMMYLFPSIGEIPASQNIYQWVYHSFEPLLFRGGMMSMSMGREISRNKVSEHGKARNVIESILLLSQSAAPEHSARLKSLVKSLVNEDKATSDYTANLSGIFSIKILQGILSDKNIPLRKDYFMSKQFANMDRTVHQTPNYAFAISMHSERIFNYESINDENLKGWHTSNGMTYLYGADPKQFEDNFWATVNYHRLPGTTVITGTKSPPGKTSAKSWVGGASLYNKYAVSGMDLAPHQTSLSAKKSWFMFDNEIVALGAGITNQDQRNVSTIIEQRKLNQDNSNQFSVNGEVLPGIFSERAFRDVRTAHLSGVKLTSGIGYYFPNGIDLSIERKTQTGTWSEQRLTGPATPISRNYVSMWKDHGSPALDENAVGNTYAYVLLPEIQPAKLKQYANNPEIRILENTAAVQAVVDDKLGLVAANFWTDSLNVVSLIGGQPYLSCDKKASVMVLEDEQKISIALADPTMRNDGVVTIELHSKAAALRSADPGIQIVQLHPHIKLVIQVKGLRGKTRNVSLTKK